MPRDLHAEAAARLGRELTDGEQRVDLAAYDRELEQGKKRIEEAVEKEKRRAIRARLTGRGDQKLRITSEIVAALRALYQAGRNAGEREAEQVGGLLALADDEDLPDELEDLTVVLRARLDRISDRIGEEADVSVAVGPALERAIDRRVLGARAAAADLVSPAFLRGLALGLFPVTGIPELAWTYSAIGDRSTCDACFALDGTRYDSWDEIMAVLPNGGPNPLCLGGSRCRCRPVMEPPDDLKPLEPDDGLDRGPSGLPLVPTGQPFLNARRTNTRAAAQLGLREEFNRWADLLTTRQKRALRDLENDPATDDDATLALVTAAILLHDGLKQPLIVWLPRTESTPATLLLDRPTLAQLRKPTVGGIVLEVLLPAGFQAAALPTSQQVVLPAGTRLQQESGRRYTAT